MKSACLVRLLKSAVAFALVAGLGLHAAAQPKRAGAEAAGSPAAGSTGSAARSSPETARSPAPAAAPNQKRRIALVIGNARYQKLPGLPNAKNDAEDMCQALRALAFEVACHINIADRSEFRQIVRTFASQLNAETMSLFYYAGHGVQINGENFLLPVSIEAKVSLDLEDDSLNLSYLLRSLEGARSSPNVVILDACRDNPFERMSGINHGLARVDPPIGTVLVYATAPNGVAMDGKGRNGLFTKHLLKHLPEPNRKLDELFQMVAMGVEQEAQSAYGMKQTPYRSFSFSGSYCLGGCEDARATARIEELARQSGEAQNRIATLMEENERLRKMADERTANIQVLEGRIHQISDQAATAGKSSKEVQDELGRLRASLTAARVEQAEVTAMRKGVTDREQEIQRLRSEAQDLGEKAKQFEEFRARVTALEREKADRSRVSAEIDVVRRQSEDAGKRIAALTEENSKLRSSVSERQAAVQDLEARLAQAMQAVASSGSNNKAAMDELSRVTAALADARNQERSASTQARDAEKREQEIRGLREQVVESQDKVRQLEELRRKIVALEQENANQSRQLNSRDTSANKARPVVIPTF